MGARVFSFQTSQAEQEEAGPVISISHVNPSSPHNDLSGTRSRSYFTKDTEAQVNHLVHGHPASERLSPAGRLRPHTLKLCSSRLWGGNKCPLIRCLHLPFKPALSLELL